MNIIFNPPDNKENQYISLLVAPLKKSGFKIYALDDFLSSYKHMKTIQLVHLNWFENIDDSSFFIALSSFFRKLVVLTAIKLMRKPLVWTMHNRASHEKGLSFFSRAIRFLLVKWADRIVVHSRASITLLQQYSKEAAAKAVYLPHPNFIGVYGPELPNTASSRPLLQLLFIGAIKPYKNIELLITLAQAYTKEIQLTIAGKPVNETYKSELERLATNTTNVYLQLRFIQDEEFPALLSKADLLALPYDLASSLNSGTVLLAFSYKKTVICPTIGTISDLAEEKDNVLAYTYTTPEQHVLKLSEKMEEAIRLKAANPNIFDHWGEQLFYYVSTKHANNKIGETLIEIYRQLLNKADK